MSTIQLQDLTRRSEQRSHCLDVLPIKMFQQIFLLTSPWIFIKLLSVYRLHLQPVSLDLCRQNSVSQFNQLLVVRHSTPCEGAITYFLYRRMTNKIKRTSSLDAMSILFQVNLYKIWKFWFNEIFASAPVCFALTKLSMMVQSVKSYEHILQ